MRKISFLLFFAFVFTITLHLTSNICFCDTFTFSFLDDFSKYPDGSDGSPDWLTTSVSWEVKKGIFINNEASKNFAIADKSIPGKLQVVEAILVLREKTGTSWKIAGLVIYQDEKNYWHMALAEKPDNTDKGHFVELVEMYNGVWLSHSAPATRLTQTAGKGTNFNWEYNHPYKLKIELTPEGITGFVNELDGTEQVKIGYKFDNKTVDFGKPGIDNGGFKAEFSNFSARVGMEMKMPEKVEEKKVYPPYVSRGWTGVKGKATGFFHTEEIDGIWWIIDPTGNAYYIVGTDHVNYNAHWCEKLGYAPYHRNCEKIYGSEEKWAESAVSRLLSWGFNSLGAGNLPSVRYKGLAHTEFLSMGSGFSPIDYITPKTTWTGFPNVFSPKFEKFCDKIAQKICLANRENPWLLGYFIDNELEWHQWTGGGIFADSFNGKSSEHTAKKAVVDFLEKRYSGDIGAFNKTWGTNIAKFTDLLEFQKAPAPPAAKAREDIDEYIRLVAEKYFSITAAAIRRHDPNHMILGCRFAGQVPAGIWDIAGKYCDIVTVNCYRRVDLEKGILVDGFEKDLANWYGKTKRPLMITEWSFPALDAGLPCKHGAGQRVPTQKDKAFAFTVFQKFLFFTPYIVGSDYFMWADEPELGISSTFPEDSNYGLVNVNDEPYLLLTQAATKLNPLVYKIHNQDVPEIYVREGKDRGVFVVGNSGKTNAVCQTFLWADGKLAESKKMEIAGSKTYELKASDQTTKKGGGHFFVCEAQAEDSFLETNLQDNIAEQIFYTPGPAWYDKAKKSQSVRIPLVVANPSDVLSQEAVLSFKLNEIAPTLDWKKLKKNLSVVQVTGDKQILALFQNITFEENGEISLFVDKIKPKECRTFFIYTDALEGNRQKTKIEYRTVGNGFEINNGIIKLVKTDLSNGNAFERIELNGMELGRFTPLLWQKVGQNMWVGPSRVEKIDVDHSPVALVIDMTFVLEGEQGEMKTEVDKEGKYQAKKARPHNFRTKYRFAIYPGKPYFTSQVLWVENTDNEPFELGAYYHYLVSNINGNASDDEPMGKYWFDKASNVAFGIESFSPVIKIHFWKDAGGGEHPDVWREVNKVINPGERYSEAQPAVYVIATKEDERAFNLISQDIRSISNLSSKVFDAEKQ